MKEESIGSAVFYVEPQVTRRKASAEVWDFCHEFAVWDDFRPDSHRFAIRTVRFELHLDENARPLFGQKNVQGKGKLLIPQLVGRY